MLSVSINKFVIILRNKLGNIYVDLRYPTMLKLGISNLTHVFLQVNSSFNEKMVDFPGIYYSVYTAYTNYMSNHESLCSYNTQKYQQFCCRCMYKNNNDA